MSKKLASLTRLMKAQILALPVKKAMISIGTLIDTATDEKDLAALDCAIGQLIQMEKRTLNASTVSRMHYFRANIWHARRLIAGDEKVWTWSSEAIDGEIIELRRAITHSGFIELGRLEQAQALTNLAGTLSHVGRFVEAVEMWDRALVIIPRFAMAHGNRGVGLSHYARALYDPGQGGVFMLAALHSLNEALSDNAIIDSYGNGAAIAYFSKHAEAIESAYDVGEMAASFELEGHSLGRSKAEQGYRQWCLEHRLFLNPLNDIGPHSIAGRDVMTLPSLTTSFDEGPGPPAVIEYYNGLKTEYCAARFALFEATVSQGVHYSDRDVLIYDTLSLATHGFAIERAKMAFRSAYALFDKIGFLINAYMKLGHPERQVSFRNVWFVKGNGRELHPALEDLDNWPLRGLYWLSKDIFEDDFRQVTEPDASELYELRNHLEHKFVSTHDWFTAGLPTLMGVAPNPGVFYMADEDLFAKAQRQLKLARAALTYLALGVHFEERRRASTRGEDTIIASMPLYVYKDTLKRRYQG